MHAYCISFAMTSKMLNESKRYHIVILPVCSCRLWICNYSEVIQFTHVVFNSISNVLRHQFLVTVVAEEFEACFASKDCPDFETRFMFVVILSMDLNFFRQDCPLSKLRPQ